MHQSRKRLSLYNTITAIGLTLVNGLLGIVVTRLIISRFGSDFNGLNSTANQIVNVLLILEGGFTLATNVALFSPLGRQDYALVNGILSATRKKFRLIGISFLGVGMIATGAYTAAVNSGLEKPLIASIILMTILPQAFNLYYAASYRVLLQAQQREYIISSITMLTIGLGHAVNILLITRGGDMWMVRFTTMVFALFNSLLIAGWVKRANPYLDFSAEPRRDLIKGTNDVLTQKITGVIYNAAPIVFLSVSPVGGTLLASIYAVYNNVFTMIKSLLHGVIDAPRLGLGQLLSERSREEIWPVFRLYEYIAFLAVFVLLSTACTLIFPFIEIYTAGVNDINYCDRTIALLMVSICTIEMLHIPSGHLINMAGMFQIAKRFQLAACFLLVAAMSIGGSVWGMYGILAALLLAATVLAFLEMGYVHLYFFRNKTGTLLKMLLPLVFLGIAVCAGEAALPVQINGYISFVEYGFLFFVLHCCAAVFAAAVFNRKDLISICSIVKSSIKRH